MTTWINVNKHRIKANIKAQPKDRLPPLRVSRSKNGPGEYGSRVEIHDDSGLVAIIHYSPDQPLLKCGARVAIEVLPVYEVRITE